MLQGGEGNDILYGGAGADILSGGDGADRLSGGLSGDVLYGGAGADSFVFGSVDERGNTVMDFRRAEGDRLDLSGIFGQGLDTQAQLVAGGYAKISDARDGVRVHVDADGGGDGYVLLATLRGASAAAPTPAATCSCCARRGRRARCGSGGAWNASANARSGWRRCWVRASCSATPWAG